MWLPNDLYGLYYYGPALVHFVNIFFFCPHGENECLQLSGSDMAASSVESARENTFSDGLIRFSHNGARSLWIESFSRHIINIQLLLFCIVVKGPCQLIFSLFFFFILLLIVDDFIRRMPNLTDLVPAKLLQMMFLSAIISNHLHPVRLERHLLRHKCRAIHSLDSLKIR